MTEKDCSCNECGCGNKKDDTVSDSSIEMVTFGCRLNSYESEVMRQHAAAAGMKNIIIFNTCSVTNEAERQARQAIRRAKKDNPDAQIIVTGCSAQIAPEKYEKMPEVAKIIGNDLKLKPETWGAKAKTDRVQVNDIMAVKETAGHLINGFDGQTRAFLQVQNGCDHRCTFCIIPFGRGNSRSVPIGEIVDQVRMLVDKGFKEVVLTGVDVTSYGTDLPGEPTLGQMIRRLLMLVPDLPRVRLSSLDPIEIDDDLWHLIEHESRLMPHLHLSFQAGDNMILKRMKRRHSREDAIDFCKRARAARPDMGFGADIIAGFPTETQEMFQNTLDCVRDCDLTYLHVFPYSSRPNTPAARMPQLKGDVIKDRAARLRELGKEQELAFMRRFIGREVAVLMERGQIGHTEEFIPVDFNGYDGDVPPAGELVTVRLTGINDDGKMVGTIK